MLLVTFLFSKAINTLARKFPFVDRIRHTAVNFYSQSKYDDLKSATQKLLIESFFDIYIANLVNLVGYYRYSQDFKGFFEGFGNQLNSALCIFHSVLLTVFGFYYHVRIHYNKDDFHKPEVKEKFDNFLEDLHCKDAYSSLFNVFFLYRRIFVATMLVCVTEYPSLQILALMVANLVTLLYIGGTTPYEGLIRNFNEGFNEICIVGCIYIIMLFMMSTVLEFLLSMTNVFIVICALNILNFAVQALVGIILGSF